MKQGDAVMLRMGNKRECGYITEIREDDKACIDVVRRNVDGHHTANVIRSVSFLEEAPAHARQCDMCGLWFWPGVTVNSSDDVCGDRCHKAQLEIRPKTYGWHKDQIRARIGYEASRDPNEPDEWRV